MYEAVHEMWHDPLPVFRRAREGLFAEERIHDALAPVDENCGSVTYSFSLWARSCWAGCRADAGWVRTIAHAHGRGVHLGAVRRVDAGCREAIEPAVVQVGRG